MHYKFTIVNDRARSSDFDYFFKTIGSIRNFKSVFSRGVENVQRSFDMSFNANLVAGLLVTALCSASCGVSASGAGQPGAPTNPVSQPGTQQILNGNEVVLIDSINGVASSSHATTITAHPGDVIQLVSNTSALS